LIAGSAFIQIRSKDFEANDDDKICNKIALRDRGLPIIRPEGSFFSEAQVSLNALMKKLGDTVDRINGALDEESGWDAARWRDAVAPYFEAHGSIGIGAEARGSQYVIIDEAPGAWRVRQIFDDPEGDHDWGISAVVDLDASDEAGSAVLRITDVGQLSGF